MQYIQFQPQLSSDVPTASDGTINFFVDSTDNTLKIKNESGSTITTSAGITDITYSELREKISGSTLVAGTFYKITDFKTCYDQPDFDINGNPITGDTTYKQGSIEPIVVFSLSSNSIGIDAFQPGYPQDKIKYDYTFDTTEMTGGEAFGRIIERIDEFKNRTDYDHKSILFKRYRSYSHKLTEKLNGTIEVLADGVVVGDGTNFESDFTIGSIVAIPNLSGTYFEVLSITGATGMTITGLTLNTIGAGTLYYSTINDGIISHKRNNISISDYDQYYTFDIENELIVNNHIGDFTLRLTYDNPGTFILANNVFIGGEYSNNTFGNGCYNNTFDDDCTNNKIGDYFRNNITNDDFDNNIIGNFFENNYITANFNRNIINNFFGDNIILNSDFYRNEIGEYFENNEVYNNDFQNNDIGNNYNNNSIYYNFYNNLILNGFNNNNIRSDFYHNNLSSGFNGNNINAAFYENTIGFGFGYNTIGVENQEAYFYRNKISSNVYSNLTTGDTFNNVIGSYFTNNQIQTNFAYNKIGEYFQSNTIANDFGYGGGNNRGNVILNYFTNNIVGEYFYDNVIGNNFEYNTISNDFRYNTIKSPVNTTDFSTSTYVYGDYNTEVFRNTDGTSRLSLYSGDTLTIFNITD